MLLMMCTLTLEAVIGYCKLTVEQINKQFNLFLETFILVFFGLDICPNNSRPAVPRDCCEAMIGQLLCRGGSSQLQIYSGINSDSCGKSFV